MNEEELKKQYNLFTEAWRFYRKWAIQIPLSDEQWQQIIQEAGEIRGKHENKESAKCLMIAVLESLDEVEKKVRK
ncbi:MAG: hypothetical protein ACI4DX_05970 [Oliverpabstia sp.]